MKNYKELIERGPNFRTGKKFHDKKKLKYVDQKAKFILYKKHYVGTMLGQDGKWNWTVRTIADGVIEKGIESSEEAAQKAGKKFVDRR
jgi:hypothetical protein